MSAAGARVVAKYQDMLLAMLEMGLPKEEARREAARMAIKWWEQQLRRVRRRQRELPDLDDDAEDDDE